jgi:hypothetical protein
MRHLTVYREAGRYAGWPANYGIWIWGDEIVVGFTVGAFKASPQGHARDKSQPFATMQARSHDGGATWAVEPLTCPAPGGRALSADEHMDAGLRVAEVLAGEVNPVRPCPGGIDFSQPELALMCARSGLSAGARSWFYASTDRCHTWAGPWALPLFGQTGLAARTDVIPLNAQECLFWLTAAKPDGHEGRVFCARAEEGGARWRFLSWVTPEPVGYTIMPASVALSPTHLLTAVRCYAGRESADQRCWIDLYASTDGGQHWSWLAQPAPDTGRGGNPPTLTRLRDGRLCLVYGYRAAPFGLRATLSADEGRAWSAPRILRADGGCPDLGYPRTVQRQDGALVTAYYYNDALDGDRYIAATIWEP